MPFGMKRGPLKYISDVEEAELVTFLTGCSAIGYAKSKQEVNSEKCCCFKGKKGRACY